MATEAEKNAPQRKEKFMKSIATLVLISAIIGPGIYGCGYTAPTAPPSGSNPTHTPTPTPNPTPTTCGNPDNAKLNGQYAFLFTGFEGTEFVTVAGSFTADGRGNITTGVVDASIFLSVFTNQDLLGGFTYSVCPDNRGTLILSTAEGAAMEDNLTFVFSFALDSFSAAGVASSGRLIDFIRVPGFTGQPVIGTGVLAKQDPAAFSSAAINGGYAFGFAGNGTTGNLLVADGRFTASGGSLGAGQVDTNDGGMAALNLPLTGTYTVGANGRGTAVLNITGQPGLSNFSFYVVSATELLFVEVDPRGSSHSSAISGSALQQSGGPFAASSLNGASVFNLTGLHGAGSDVVVGQETLNGSGSLSGTIDENNAGAITSNMAFTGTYTVDANGLGRGVITLVGDPNPKPFYLVSSGKGFIIDTGGSAQAGIFEPQTGGPFSNASVSGNYVLGTLPSPMNFLLSPVSGVVTGNGASSLNGTSDGSGGTGQSFTGSYSVAANGRTTLAITPSMGSPSNMVFYLVSPSRAVGIQVDAGAANTAVNVFEK